MTVAPRARTRARHLFLDEAGDHGCAEATYLALAEAFGLPNEAEDGVAMAFNGGIAYSGATCGAITGAAMAIGRQLAREINDHAEAKRRAREATADLIGEFWAEFGATECRTLIGRSIRSPQEHEAFIADGTWRETCTRQIECAVERAIALASSRLEEGLAKSALRGMVESEPIGNEGVESAE